MTFPRRLLLRLAAASPALWTIGALAETQSYPTRPVRVIVPLSAGSAADILARQLTAKMAESFGQPVVVENRPGAGTTVGTDTVARSAPDGHTLLITSAGFAASAAIYPKLAYDPLKDMAPVSQLGIAPVVVVAAPSLGAKSIADLIALSKKQPDGISFGSAGVGSSTHFAGELFKLAAGIKAVHVPYKGPPEALRDTIAGRIQYCLSPVLPALPFVRDGKLLALAVTTSERSPMLKDAPTIAESGLADFDYQDWWGMFAPAATPGPVIQRISREVERVLQLGDVRQQLESLGRRSEIEPAR
jgi:tripartite-type tricarboxylate transporter receptor subunit TctC